jgi:hypothetical protein
MEVAGRKNALAAACLALELPICAAAHMAGIVEGLVAEAHDKDQLDEQTVWAVMHLCEMVKGLRDQYRTSDGDEGEQE